MRAGGLAVLLAATAWPDQLPRDARDVLAAPPPTVRSARFHPRLRIGGDPVPLPDGGLLIGPDRARIDWHDPAGGTLGSWLVVDGRLVWRDPTTRRAWLAPHAGAVAEAFTGGHLALADALHLAAGHPADLGRPIDARWRPDGTVEATWRGDVSFTAVHDARGRPLRGTVHGPSGTPVLGLRWLWDDGLRAVEILAPEADTVLALDFGPWSHPDIGPDAFEAVPEGFSVARLGTWPAAPEAEEQGHRPPGR